MVVLFFIFHFSSYFSLFHEVGRGLFLMIIFENNLCVKNSNGLPLFFSKLKITFAKEEENICFWLGWGGVGWGGVPDEHYFIKIQIYDVISPHFHDFSKNMVMRVS